MTEATITAAPVGVAQQVSAAALQGAPSKGRRLRRRHLWLIPGLAVAIYANLLGEDHGVGILALVLFGLAPDLPRWILGRFGGQVGSLAIPMSNLMHQPLVAFAALAIAAAGAANGIIPIVALVATLVWSSHIVVGFGLRDGLRHPDGSPRSDPEVAR
jgi:hypothetical protein